MDNFKIEYETHSQFLIDFWFKLVGCAAVIGGGVLLTFALNWI